MNNVVESNCDLVSDQNITTFSNLRLVCCMADFLLKRTHVSNLAEKCLGIMGNVLFVVNLCDMFCSWAQTLTIKQDYLWILLVL